MRRDDVMGLLVWDAQRSRRLRSDWDTESLHDRRLVSPRVDAARFGLSPTDIHYLIRAHGHSPALVANLWDVTDKDIDKFADHTFRLSGLSRMPRGEHAGDETQRSRPGAGELEEGERPLMTLTAAVAQSRDVPLLKYLNGAAPVVYGIPVRFRA